MSGERGGGGGGGVLLYLCTLPLSTLLQGHFYMLCIVMDIGYSKFGSMSSPGGRGKLELYCDGYGKFGQVLEE